MERTRFSLMVMVGALLVLPALAGCIGGGAGPDAGPAVTDGIDDASGGPEDAGAADGPTVLAFDAEAANATVEESGTFAVHEPFFPAGWLTDSAVRSFDITDMVPTGVPVHLNITLTHDTGHPAGAFGANELDVWIEADQATVYWISSAYAPGQIAMSRTVVRQGGSISVAVAAYAPVVESADGLDYTVRIDSAVRPAVVPTDVAPVEVALAPGQTVNARAPGGEFVGFGVYGPDDAFLDRTGGDGEAAYTVPDDAPAGDYVLGIWSPAPAVTLTTDAPDPQPMRALIRPVEWSEPTPYGGTGEETWSFDLDAPPLLVGLFFQDTGTSPYGGPALAPGEVAMDLTLPGGDAVSLRSACAPQDCVFIAAFGTGASVGIGITSDLVEAGTYQGAISSDVALGLEYGHYVAHYVR